jgi:RimJ/RimL family protein N-acetyltransferase
VSERYTVAQVAPDHWRWMSDRTGVTLTADFSAVAALDTRREETCAYCGTVHAVIRGMVAYSDATPNAAHIHIMLEHPVAYRTLRQVALPLLFEVSNREVALAQVRAGNERVRRLLAHEGFHPVATLPGAFKAGEDIIIYRLDRADWRARGG